MTAQEKNLGKNKRGRPAIGRGVQVNIMLRPEQAEALDKWASLQSDNPARPEAVRRLMDAALQCSATD